MAIKFCAFTFTATARPDLSLYGYYSIANENVILAI